MPALFWRRVYDYSWQIINASDAKQMEREGVEHMREKAYAFSMGFLGMSQSNVSKALSLKDKKCFTLEQTCNIADYFKVSVDYLVGKRMAYSAANNREIAEMLVTFIESGAVSFEEVKLKEHVYTPGYPQGTVNESDNDMVYPALFFRNYWTPELMYDEDGTVRDELLAFGNTTNNYQINEFLRKFIQIYTVYKRGELFEETYKAVVQDYLSRVE